MRLEFHFNKQSTTLEMKMMLIAALKNFNAYETSITIFRRCSVNAWQLCCS
jgi:hypothetical protein